MDTGKAHGAALGDDEVAEVKRILGFDPEQSFVVEDTVLAHTRGALERGKRDHAAWQEHFDTWAGQNPQRSALYQRLQHRELPDGWDESLPRWEPDEKGIATRKASSAVLNAIGEYLPELWGGSADLAESN